MMFLVRSTFWLSIVVSNMPLDHGQAVRAVDQTQGAVVASAANVVKAKCAQESASCRTILTAAGVALAPNVERSRNVRGGPRAGGMGKARQPSANSLDAADLATPWRGRPSKSGA
jgi:hypothetical protein